MAVVTLLFPRSVSTQGKQFFKGVPTPVSDEVGRNLSVDSRFEVKGLPGDTRADAAYIASVREGGGRPYVKSVRLQAIRDANDILDPEIEENYEANGLPSIAALKKLLGWEPNESDIRSALRPGADRFDIDGKPVHPLTSKAVQAHMRTRGATKAPAVEKPLTVALNDDTGHFVEDPDALEGVEDDEENHVGQDEAGDAGEGVEVEGDEDDANTEGETENETEINSGSQPTPPPVASGTKKVKMKTLVLNAKKKPEDVVDPTTEGSIKLPLGGNA